MNLPIDYAKLTDEQWAALTPEQLSAVPDGYPKLILAPGRYYACHVSVPISKEFIDSKLPSIIRAILKIEQLGGELSATLWRHDSEPAKWHLTTMLSTQLETEKMTSGFVGDLEGTEEEVTELVQKALTPPSPMVAHWLYIQGDYQQAAERLKNGRYAAITAA